MKEQEPQPYRKYLVCSDDYKIVSNRTKEEMESLVLLGQVNWIICNRQSLQEFDLNIYKAYLTLKDNTPGSPSNTDIMELVNKDREEPLSRNAIARARRRIARILSFKIGW
jgi:hypothetical protein